VNILHYRLQAEECSILLSTWEHATLDKNLFKETHLKHHFILVAPNEDIINFTYDPFFNLQHHPAWQISLSHTQNVIVSVLNKKTHAFCIGIDIEHQDRNITESVLKWMKRQISDFDHFANISTIEKWCRYEAQYKAEQKVKEYLNSKVIAREFIPLEWQKYMITICKINLI